MTILELREKRAKAWEATKAFLDSHRNDKGMLSAEDDATYSRMEQEITDLGKEIARLERQEALDAELNRPVNKPLTGKPMNGKETAKTGRATQGVKMMSVSDGDRVTAVARKLCHIVFAVMRDQVPYDPARPGRDPSKHPASGFQGAIDASVTNGNRCPRVLPSGLDFI